MSNTYIKTIFRQGFGTGSGPRNERNLHSTSGKAPPEVCSCRFVDHLLVSRAKFRNDECVEKRKLSGNCYSRITKLGWNQVSILEISILRPGLAQCIMVVCSSYTSCRESSAGYSLDSIRVPLWNVESCFYLPGSCHAIAVGRHPPSNGSR